METRPLGQDNAAGRLSKMDHTKNQTFSEAGLRKALEICVPWVDGISFEIQIILVNAPGAVLKLI
jgi:hypothetical protein